MGNEKTKISNAVYQIWNAGIISGVVLLGVGRFLGISNPSRQHVLLTCVVILVCAGLQYLPKRGKVILFCALIVPSGIFMRYVGMTQTANYLQNYLDWLGNGHHWQKEWLAGYLRIQTVLIAFCSYLYALLCGKKQIIKRLTAGVLTGYLLLMMFGKQSMSHGGSISILMYLIFVLVEWTQECWKKNRHHGIRQHMLWISPFLMLYLILLCMMPYSEDKFEWTFVKEATEKIKEVAINLSSQWNLGDGTEFSVAMSGFSEAGSLQGEIRENDKKVMQVERSAAGSGSLYLAGVTSDFFDGHRWYTEWEAGNREQLMDCLETLYAIMLYDGDNQDDYMRSTGLKVRYQNINTRSLFIPRKVRSLYVGSERQNLSLTENTLSGGKKRKYGTEYDITYYRMNLGNEAFGTLLNQFQNTHDRMESVQKEEVWESVVSYYAGGKVEIPYSELEEYRTAMKKRYTQEVSLSGDVQEWLNQVTGQADSDMDKLRRLEEALSAYEYTLTPGAIPEKVQSPSDFLDYFLLEKKEGYCTYFATAFVLLARAEGIPARYVQGYCVPMKTGEVQVYNTMAHAWPEVYMEGMGWIPFEPTPGRREYRYTSWRTKEERERAQDMNRRPVMEQPNPVTEQTEVLPIEQETEIDENRLPSLFGIAVGIFLLLVVLFLTLERLISRYLYGRMLPSERYKVQMQRNLRLLYLLGIRRAEEETLQELQNRIEQKYEIPLKSMESYQQFLYGEIEVTLQMMDEMEEDRKQIRSRIKEKIISAVQRKNGYGRQR